MSRKPIKFDEDGLPIPIKEQQTVSFDSDGLPIPIKKKVGTVSFGETYSSPELDSETPSTGKIPEVVDIGGGNLMPANPILLSKKYNELNNATKEVSYPSSGKGGQLLTTVPDEDSRKVAKQIKEYLGDINPEQLNSEMKGLSDEDINIHGEELLADRKQNPQLYQRKLGRLKWERGLNEELLKSVDSGRLNNDDYNNISASIKSSLENSSVGDYKQQRENVNSVANAIKQFGGENKEQLLKEYATEVSKVYGNSYNFGFEKSKQDSPESKYLTTPEAQLGYDYIKDLSPEKAEQYKRLFVDVKSLNDKPEEQKGYNHLMQTLEETGIGLMENSVNEELNSLKTIAEKTGGLTPEQIDKATKLEEKLSELNQKKTELDSKYPDRINDKVDDAIQEILGQNLSWGSYAAGSAGKAFKNTAQGIWEAVSTPFMSDESNRLRELYIMGQSLDENQVYRKTDANKALVTDTLVIKPELQSQIDAIKNDKTLSREQKELKLYPLLKNNSDKFGRVPIQGGKFNVNPSSILYGVTDLGTTLLPFIALEAATGGIGGAGAAAKFLRTFTAAAATSFHDEYANAILEGKSESDAYKEAMGLTAINSFAMAGAGTPEAVRSMAGLKTSAGQIISRMSDAEIKKVLERGTKSKALNALKDRISATPEMIKKGAESGAKFEVAMNAAQEAKKQLYNTEIDREEQFKHNLLNIANFSLLGGVLGHVGYKSPSNLQKSGLIEFGKNPDGFLASIEQMKKEGALSQADFDQRKGLIEKSAEAYKSLPQLNDKGKPLSTKEQGEVLYNTVIKNEGKKAASTLPPQQAEKAEMKSMVADYANGIILENPTDKQLESRKSTLEKQIEGKDENGKPLLPEKELLKAKAQLEAVNDAIQRKENGVEVQSPINTGESIPLKTEEQSRNENGIVVEKPMVIPEPITISSEPTKPQPTSSEIETPVGFKNRIHEGGIVLGEPTNESHITENGYTYRSVGEGEISAIDATGGVFSREGKQKGGNTNVKYWSKGNGKFFYRPNQEVIRVKNENISEGEVVSKNNLEIWDKTQNKFIPFNEAKFKTQPTNEAKANTTVSDVSGEVNDTHLKVSSDAKTALADGRKKQEVVADENGNPIVKETEFTKDDADLELDRLEALAKKGKLTPEEFQKSYFGQSTDTTTFKAASEQIKNDAVGFVEKLRNSFEGEAEPPPTNEAKAPEVQQSPEVKEPTITEANKTGQEAETAVEKEEQPPVVPPVTQEFDKMATSIPNGGEVKKYLSGDTIKKYEEGTELRNNQEITAQELEPALKHGVETIDKAKEIFGDKYVEKTLDYIEREKLNPENKALLYVSLENDMAKRILAEPDNLGLKKLQDLVRTKSQAYLRSNSLAINMGRLRKFAEAGYDISKVTDKFFSSKELEQKAEIEKAVQADAETIQKESELKETEGGFSEELEKKIQQGVEKEINAIYEKLPTNRKRAADKAIKALDNIQKKLRSKTYDASLGIPVAIIDAGITTIKTAIKAGVSIADAIELGIKKIKDKYGKEWDKEDDFRKDMVNGFKESGIKDEKDINPKKYVKESLISQGFGKEVTVTVNKKDASGNDIINKEGKPEKEKIKKQILDWKKLAGEEGSVDKISENVSKSLQKDVDSGKLSKEEVIEMKDDFIQEYNDLRASVIEKGLNELASRNKTTVTPAQKSAAKKLAEMYNYGLFDKEPIEFEKALAKTIGVAKLNEERFQQGKELGDALAKLFSSDFKGKRLSEREMKSAIQVVDDKMRYIIHQEAKQHGSTSFMLADMASTYMDAVQRMTLNNLKQALENPMSGKLEKIYSSIGYEKGMPKELSEHRKKVAANLYKEMVLQSGTAYGDISSTFVNKGNLEMMLKNMPESKVLHGVTSTLLGKTTLDAVDSFYKAKITNQKFTYNLIQILTKDRLINGKVEKGMSKDDAKKYVAEKLTGQSFKDAQTTAKAIIDKVNDGKKEKVLKDSPEFIDRLANDIVTAALVNGEKITEDMVTAAYNAAYKAAGRGLGHVANNWISRQVGNVTGEIETRINDAKKEKDYRKAAFLTVESMFFRNIANPFVGGGTNWVVLKAEKTGLGLVSGLGSMMRKGAKMDLASESGIKNLEKAMYENMKIKDKFIRGAVGGLTTVLVASLFYGIASSDEYRKWRSKNMWAARYLDTFTPEFVLATMAARDDKMKRYLESTLNQNEQFDKTKKLIKVGVAVVMGNKQEALGLSGEVAGGIVGVPIPWRLVRDGQQIVQGLSGGEIYKVDNRPSKSLLEGYFKGGMIDYLGFAPEQPKSMSYTTEELKKPVLKLFIDKGVKMPEMNPEKIQTKEVNNKVTEKLSDYDEKTQKLFIDTKKKYLENELTKLKNNEIPVYVNKDGHATTEKDKNNERKYFNQLTADQIQNIISTSILKRVTEKVKKEVLTNKKPIKK